MQPVSHGSWKQLTLTSRAEKCTFASPYPLLIEACWESPLQGEDV